MTEKIVKIEHVEAFTDRDSHSGYRITTTEQIIELSISNEQQCCESWGYLICAEEELSSRENHNLNDWHRWVYDAELLAIKLIDEKRDVKVLKDFKENEDYAVSVMFIDIVTSKGVLTFTAYNAHNGYYGHEVSVKSKQLTHKGIL